MQDDYDPFSEEPAPHVAMEKAGNEGMFSRCKRFAPSPRTEKAGGETLSYFR